MADRCADRLALTRPRRGLRSAAGRRLAAIGAVVLFAAAGCSATVETQVAGPGDSADSEAAGRGAQMQADEGTSDAPASGDQSAAAADADGSSAADSMPESDASADAATDSTSADAGDSTTGLVEVPIDVDLDAPLDAGAESVRRALLAEGWADPTEATCFVTQVTPAVDPERALKILDSNDGTDAEVDFVRASYARCREYADQLGVAAGATPVDDSGLVAAALVPVSGEDAVDGVSGSLGWVAWELDVPPGTVVNGDWDFAGLDIEIGAQPSMSSPNMLEQEVGYNVGEGDEGIALFENRGDEQWVIAVDNADRASQREISVRRQFIVGPGAASNWNYVLECAAAYYQDTPYADADAVENLLETICGSLTGTVLTQFEPAS